MHSLLTKNFGRSSKNEFFLFLYIIENKKESFIMQTLFKKTDLPIKGGALLKPLIELRGRQCECCKNTTWLN